MAIPAGKRASNSAALAAVRGILEKSPGASPGDIYSHLAKDGFLSIAITNALRQAGFESFQAPPPKPKTIAPDTTVKDLLAETLASRKGKELTPEIQQEAEKIRQSFSTPKDWVRRHRDDPAMLSLLPAILGQEKGKPAKPTAKKKAEKTKATDAPPAKPKKDKSPPSQSSQLADSIFAELSKLFEAKDADGVRRKLRDKEFRDRFRSATGQPLPWDRDDRFQFVKDWFFANAGQQNKETSPTPAEAQQPTAMENDHHKPGKEKTPKQEKPAQPPAESPTEAKPDQATLATQAKQASKAIDKLKKRIQKKPKDSTPEAALAKLKQDQQDSAAITKLRHSLHAIEDAMSTSGENEPSAKAPTDSQPQKTLGNDPASPPAPQEESAEQSLGQPKISNRNHDRLARSIIKEIRGILASRQKERLRKFLAEAPPGSANSRAVREAFWAKEEKDREIPGDFSPTAEARERSGRLIREVATAIMDSFDPAKIERGRIRDLMEEGHRRVFEIMNKTAPAKAESPPDPAPAAAPAQATEAAPSAPAAPPRKEEFPLPDRRVQRGLFDELGDAPSTPARKGGKRRATRPAAKPPLPPPPPPPASQPFVPGKKRFENFYTPVKLRMAGRPGLIHFDGYRLTGKDGADGRTVFVDPRDVPMVVSFMNKKGATANLDVDTLFVDDGKKGEYINISDDPRVGLIPVNLHREIDDPTSRREKFLLNDNGKPAITIIGTPIDGIIDPKRPLRAYGERNLLRAAGVAEKTGNKAALEDIHKELGHRALGMLSSHQDAVTIGRQKHQVYKLTSADGPDGGRYSLHATLDNIEKRLASRPVSEGGDPGKVAELIHNVRRGKWSDLRSLGNMLAEAVANDPLASASGTLKSSRFWAKAISGLYDRMATKLEKEVPWHKDQPILIGRSKAPSPDRQLPWSPDGFPIKSIYRNSPFEKLLRNLFENNYIGNKDHINLQKHIADAFRGSHTEDPYQKIGDLLKSYRDIVPQRFHEVNWDSVGKRMQIDSALHDFHQGHPESIKVSLEDMDNEANGVKPSPWRRSWAQTGQLMQKLRGHVQSTTGITATDPEIHQSMARINSLKGLQEAESPDGIVLKGKKPPKRRYSRMARKYGRLIGEADLAGMGERPHLGGITAAMRKAQDPRLPIVEQHLAHKYHKDDLTKFRSPGDVHEKEVFSGFSITSHFTPFRAKGPDGPTEVRLVRMRIPGASREFTCLLPASTHRQIMDKIHAAASPDMVIEPGPIPKNRNVFSDAYGKIHMLVDGKPVTPRVAEDLKQVNLHHPEVQWKSPEQLELATPEQKKRYVLGMAAKARKTYIMLRHRLGEYAGAALAHQVGLTPYILFPQKFLHRGAAEKMRGLMRDYISDVNFWHAQHQEKEPLPI